MDFFQQLHQNSKKKVFIVTNTKSKGLTPIGGIEPPAAV